MFKITFIAILCFTASACFGQIGYQKGYFITNDGKRTECFIKNVDWLVPPKQFSYQLSAGSETQSQFIAEVKEFGVANDQYIRANVKIDNSSNDVSKLTMSRAPEWIDEMVFLKVLVEGKANLYYYRMRGEDRFFYNVDSSPIEQLIYKLYLSKNYQSGSSNSRSNEIKTISNSTFQNQLKNGVNCQKYTDARLKQLQYNEGTLTSFFVENNECSGNSRVKLNNDSTRTLFRLKLAPGVDFSSMNAEYEDSRTAADFNPKTQFRFGVELELVLPFNRNKWAVVLEPTYQSYSSETKSGRTTFDYKSIELPLGVRHYFFINNKLAIFVNGDFVLDIPLTYKMQGPVSFDAPSTVNFGAAGGLGFSIWRFTIEGRYYTRRTVLVNEYNAANLFFDYTKSSVILGFRF